MTAVVQGRPPRALETEEPDVMAAFSTTAESPDERYARMRAEYPIALQGGSGASGGARAAWVLTRYDDIVAAARDTDSFGQSIRFVGQRRPPLESNPPEHRQWRRLLQPFFLPKAMAAIEPFARLLARRLVHDLVASGGGDAARGIAQPLPPQVLLHWLGLPPADWEQVKAACEAAYLQGSDDADERAAYAAADDWLWGYARAAVANSTDGPIAAMLAAKADDPAMTDDLIVGVVRLLLAAGHDSTTSAIGICIDHVAADQALQSTLRAETRRIAPAIEEMLRLRAPVLQMPRTAMRDVEMAGRKLAAGDAVLLAFASGNLDESAFPEADRFILDRSPNRHLSFGTGIHTCIGNILARQEIRLVLEELLAATRSFAIDGVPEREFWHPHGSTALPLRCEAT